MRPIIIAALASILTAVLTYSFLRKDSFPEQLTGVTSGGVQSDSNLQSTLEDLAIAWQRDQFANQAQLQKTQQEQARLNATLLGLVARVGSMESALSAPSKNAVVEDKNAQLTGAIDTSNDDPAPPSRKISEAELGQWMDESLSVGSADSHLTAQATEQAAMSLAKTPGVNLEAMQCDPRFCRATFASKTGRAPNVGDLFGEPPFITEGFTVNEADGRVSVYFTQPGVTLADVRGEMAGL